MRYELTDHEWTAIKPMLPNKPRGVPRVNDRRVLNGIFWVLRSGAPWRDLPGAFGPYTTCYNRFVRWRRAGVWGRIIDTLAGAPRCGCPDDRHFNHPRASAWSMHQKEPTAADGAITGWFDQHDSCGCRRQRLAGPPCANARRDTRQSACRKTLVSVEVRIDVACRPRL